MFSVSAATFPWWIFALLLIAGSIYSVYNSTRPLVTRRVTLTDRRVEQNWLVSRFHPYEYFMTFIDNETGERMEKRIPHLEREIYNSTNLGDEGMLTTRGAHYVRFLPLPKMPMQE